MLGCLSQMKSLFENHFMLNKLLFFLATFLCSFNVFALTVKDLVTIEGEQENEISRASISAQFHVPG